MQKPHHESDDFPVSEQPAAAELQPLDTRLDAEAAQERRQAVRALLRNSLLSADGPHALEFGLVRRHAEWLRHWFAEHPRWNLQVDRELARLRKTPVDLSDSTRPARDRKSGAAFTRRRYVLLCLALAALERSDRQTVLGKLAEAIMALTAADPALAAAGVHFDLQNYDQRRDLVQVVRLLLDLHVLARVQGDEQQYLAERGDVLYSINRQALAALLSLKRGPSTIDAPTFELRLEALSDEPPPETTEGRQRRIRTRLMRRLLDDPVLYYAELDADELAYLQTRRGELLRQIEEATGLLPELRREGIALLDEAGDLTDVEILEEGTVGHLTLLLAEWLTNSLRRRPRSSLAVTAITRQTAKLISTYGRHWRKGVAEPGAAAALTAAALDRLAALGLVRRTADRVQPLPAIARYGVQPIEALSAISPSGPADVGEKADHD
jgi:uncharacterized protein (TIGR02678 family)